MLEIGEVPRSLFVMSAMPKDSMGDSRQKAYQPLNGIRYES